MSMLFFVVVAALNVDVIFVVVAALPVDVVFVLVATLQVDVVAAVDQDTTLRGHMGLCAFVENSLHFVTVNVT